MGKVILKLLLAHLFIVTFLNSANAETKVIYGEDNRVDANNSDNPLFITLAGSTAALIKDSNIQSYNSEQVELSGNTLYDRGICESERFSKQPGVAECSGFLIADDLLVTAGHCMKNANECDPTVSWVFDYKANRENQESVIVDKTNIYKCERVVSYSLNYFDASDYAVIKLNRVVPDRTPLKFRKKGTPELGDELVVIGHPSGLPTKIADGGTVKEIKKGFFKTNLDTFSINSGSPILNAKTGIVEGILVRGGLDYEYHIGKRCNISRTIHDTESAEEQATLMSTIKITTN